MSYSESEGTQRLEQEEGMGMTKTLIGTNFLTIADDTKLLRSLRSAEEN